MLGIIIQSGLPLLVTILFIFALRSITRELGLIDRTGSQEACWRDLCHRGLTMAVGLAVGSLYGYNAIQGFLFFIAALVMVGFRCWRRLLGPILGFLMFSWLSQRVRNVRALFAGCFSFRRDGSWWIFERPSRWLILHLLATRSYDVSHRSHRPWQRLHHQGREEPRVGEGRIVGRLLWKQ